VTGKKVKFSVKSHLRYFLSVLKSDFSLKIICKINQTESSAAGLDGRPLPPIVYRNTLLHLGALSLDTHMDEVQVLGR